MYEHKALHVKLDSGFYRIERIRDHEVLGAVDFGFRQWLEENAVCIGGGPFMGSVLPGSNRLLVTGYSPCWHGFFVSSIGGAGHTFENLGLNYVSLTGRCQTPSVLVLRREGQEEVEVELATVEPTAVWRATEDDALRDRPFRRLERHIWDRFASTYSTTPRVLAVGPAALTTDCGAIGSSKTDKKGLTHVECWAGRGGLGSRLAQVHNLFGVIFGGSFVDQDFDDRKLADTYFQKRYQMRMLLKDKEATTKYRYDETLKTGGTLGVNLAKLKDRLFHFNYRSIGWPREERMAAHRDLVAPHYLAQFNRETIDTKDWAHCGEPCPAVCKKMRGPFKKDYEPYQALGPLCGVYDQRCAEELVGFADGHAFDAIQIGGVVAWLMDLVASGLVEPGDWGLPYPPVFELCGFKVEEDSRHNADVAMVLLRALAEARGELDLRHGARVLARRIGQRIGKTREVLDRLVVNCASERGWMVPNQYWVPGMFSPMAIMGKYYEHYGDEFVPPRALGALNTHRMAIELMLDNLGFCRFHRDWAEELAPQIFREHIGIETDLAEHHHRLARRIHARNRAVMFESGRVVELLHTYLRRKRDEGVDRPELAEWLLRFDADPRSAARDYWYEIRKGVDDALAEPF